MSFLRIRNTDNNKLIALNPYQVVSVQDIDTKDGRSLALVTFSSGDKIQLGGSASEITDMIEEELYGSYEDEEGEDETTEAPNHPNPVLEPYSTFQIYNYKQNDE